MHSLKKRDEKIKMKRGQTSFRDFLREIASWITLSFYKNNGFISVYPKSDRVEVCSIKEFQENRDSLTEEWKEYDFSKDFFSNFSDVFKKIKHQAVSQVGVNENTEFSNVAVDSKNVYLSTIVTFCSEDIYYSLLVRKNSKNVFNSIFVVDNSEDIYFSKWINSSFKIFYSSYIKNSYDIRFSSNLTGCNNYIFCDNLENASYFIENKKYNKEEYYGNAEK